jgi:hypothetical protein
MFQTLTGSCPVDTNPINQSLLTTESLMMQNSDNRATQTMVALWGRPAINATGTALGLTNTLLQHRLGCATDALANPNHFTLRDVTHIHEQVSNGFLNTANRDLFRNIMLHDVASVPGFGPITLGTIITQEAAAAGLSNADRLAFQAACKIAWKGGNYVFVTTSQVDHVAMGCWASLPFRDLGVIAPKEFVFGTFVNDSTIGTTPSGNAIGQATAELLREQIRAAMHTWACRADFNSDTVIDFFDYLDFINAFAARTAGGDFNNDGVIDFFDYLDFLAAYNQGC